MIVIIIVAVAFVFMALCVCMRLCVHLPVARIVYARVHIGVCSDIKLGSAFVIHAT